MSTVCVTYTSCNTLPCSGTIPSSVVLCVSADKVAPVACAGGDIVNETYGYRFVEGELTGVTRSGDSCDVVYAHTICFDSVLVASGKEILSSDIVGVFCKGCLATWVEDLVGSEVSIRDNGDGTNTLITQHGCEYTFSSGTGVGFSVNDTASLDLNLGGLILTGNVKVSTDAGNSISIHGNGIYAPSSTGIAVTDTPTLDLTLSGSNLSGVVNVSPDSENALSAHSNGLYAPALSILDTNSVDLTLSTNTLSANSKISSDSGNQVSIHSDGLFVPAPSTTIAVSDTSSIDLTLTGSTISGAVKISPDANNCLQLHANGLYVPCGGGGGGGSFAAVWAQTGEDKVTQDELRAASGQNVTNSVWDGSQINLFGAKNEIISFNVVIEAGPVTTNAVTVTFNDLVDGSSNHISSTTATGNGVFNYVGRNIELFYVKYLPIQGLSTIHYDWSYDERHVPIKLQRPYMGAGFANAGTGWVNRPNHDKFYPEIAAPIEVSQPFNITANSNQQIWCDIYIPKTATLGPYNGNLVIKIGGVTVNTIPVSLTVRDFELPDAPSFKASTYLGTSDLNLRFLGIPYTLNSSQDTQMLPIRREFFKMLHRHKLGVWNDDVNAGYNAAPTGQPRSYWTEFLNGTAFNTGNGYAGPGKDTPNWIYMIGSYGGWNWAATQGAFESNTNAWYTYMNANFPTIVDPLYLSDESPNYAQTETWAGWVKNNVGVGQNIKTLAAVSWLNGQASIPSLIYDGVAFNWGVTSTWNSAYTYWTSSGRQAWLYNGYRPLQGSFATDDEGVSPRVSMWSCFKKGISSWFFWACNYWNHGNESQVKTHLWTDACTFGYYTTNNTIIGRTGFNYGNGDGVLTYPGTDAIYPGESFGLSGPVASLRLKHLRRGLQDVDYLTLAKAEDSGATNTIVNSIIPTVLWEYGVDDPGDPTYKRVNISWSTNPDIWEAARSSLADIIEGSSPGSNTSTYVGSFNLNLATGNQAVTGIGFQPKGLLFFGTNISGNANNAGATHYLGAASSTTKRWAGGIGAQDAQTTSVMKRNFTSSKCISAITSAGSLLYAADLVSFDADGFTVNVTTAPASAFTVYVIAVGGSGVNVMADKMDAAAATGSQSFTGVGFQPELLLTMNTLPGTTEGIGAGANTTIGITTGAGFQGISSTQGNDVTSPQTSYMQQITTRCYSRGTPGDLPSSASFTSFDADGFTLNFDRGDIAPRSGYVALTADNVKGGSFTQKTSTGAQAITGLGFTPKLVVFVSYGQVANASFQENVGRRSIGAASDATHRGCTAYATSDTTSPSSNSSRGRNDKVIMFITPGGGSPTVAAEADITSLDADGFTLNWTTADAVARQILYFAIG